MVTFVFYLKNVSPKPKFQLKSKKTILVAPLHWGLGHATRCIPIIRSLLKNGYDVLLGSDGAALLLLKKEFPELKYIELPAYDITYTKKGSFLKWKLLLKLPHIKKTMNAEKKLVKKLVDSAKIQGIISDNRFGILSKKVPSVFITHQLNVLSGNTSYLSSKMHQKVIKKFTECWVPDVAGPNNLSGILGHLTETNLPLKYIGPLSRMSHRDLPKKFDILCLLSGPEPQRTLLEELLMKRLCTSQKKVALVQGNVSEEKTVTLIKNVTIFNFLETESLETLINQSAMVISRSGYTTIMDLAVLNKPAFFIPTPGQYEQKYLAKKLKEQGTVASCKQEKFTEKKLKKVPLYKGLSGFSAREDYLDLFGLFEGE
jgi:uncharacterized protein (TIGR00661 family)